jgi:hypothetical protein
MQIGAISQQITASLQQDFRLKYTEFLMSKSKGFKMDEILKAIGEPAATLLTDTFGGGTFYIPEKCDETGVFNEIVMVIGQTAADIMVKVAGGELVCIPKLFAAKLQRRNEEIFNARRGGASVRELALKYRISQRQIHSCLVKHRRLIGQ